MNAFIEKALARLAHCTGGGTRMWQRHVRDEQAPQSLEAKVAQEGLILTEAHNVPILLLRARAVLYASGNRKVRLGKLLLCHGGFTPLRSYGCGAAAARIGCGADFMLLSIPDHHLHIAVVFIFLA